VIFALSEGSLRSQACRAELDYARALGIPVIPVIPVQVGPVQSLLATPIAEYQVIDYREPTSTAGVRLMSAVAESPGRRGLLPDPTATGGGVGRA
jgi:serine/threonine kinase PknH